MRRGVVPASQVEKNPYVCPVCENDHVKIEGRYQRGFVKEFVEDAEVGVQMNDVHEVRYTAILCKACNTRSEIETDTVVNLFVENMDLKMRVAQQSGQTVIQTPKGLVN
jgi:hypothetical protein